MADPMTRLERHLIWHVLWGRLRWLPESVERRALWWWLRRSGTDAVVDRALRDRDGWIRDRRGVWRYERPD